MGNGSIDAAKAEEAKLKYAAIHDALIKAMANDKSLLEKAKDLKSQLEVSSSLPQPLPPACSRDLHLLLLSCGTLHADGKPPSPLPP